MFPLATNQKAFRRGDGRRKAHQQGIAANAIHQAACKTAIIAARMAGLREPKASEGQRAFQNGLVSRRSGRPHRLPEHSQFPPQHTSERKEIRPPKYFFNDTDARWRWRVLAIARVSSTGGFAGDHPLASTELEQETLAES